MSDAARRFVYILLFAGVMSLTLEEAIADSVRSSTWGSIRDSIWSSVWDAVGHPVGDPVWESFKEVAHE